jgi:thymidylate kinase
MTAFVDAMAQLRAAGMPPRLRKPRITSAPGYEELDLWIERSDVARTELALRRCGFHRVRVSGQAPHLFFVSFENGLWLKLDGKLTGTSHVPARFQRATRRRPAGRRRYGPVIAVLGPDGAGKSTLLQELERRIPLGVHLAYLGGKRRSPSHRVVAKTASRRSRRLVSSAAGEVAFVARHLLRGARRLVGVYARAWMGTIVLCDRHPIEALAIDPRRTAPARMFERFVLRRIMPWPDVIIVLDAPPEVLYGRKQEHPLERLIAWRERYRGVFTPAGALFVSTDGPVEVAAEELSRYVFEASAARAGRSSLIQRTRRRS